MLLLDFIGLLLLKNVKIVSMQKYLCAGIMNDKSAISPAIVIFEK